MTPDEMSAQSDEMTDRYLSAFDESFLDYLDDYSEKLDIAELSLVECWEQEGRDESRVAGDTEAWQARRETRRGTAAQLVAAAAALAHTEATIWTKTALREWQRDAVSGMRPRVTGSD